jgi:hypothetical protein
MESQDSPVMLAGMLDGSAGNEAPCV